MMKEQQRNHTLKKNSLGYNFVLQCFYLQKWAVFCGRNNLLEFCGSTHKNIILILSHIVNDWIVVAKILCARLFAFLCGL